MPKMSNSVRTAGFILLALLAYFVFRSVLRQVPDETSEQQQTVEVAEEKFPEVNVRWVSPETHAVVAIMKGVTEPDRTVTVRSETAGVVTRASVSEGQSVKRGALLCGLGVESRAARIAEAEAAVTSATLEHESAVSLQEKGWTTSNRAAATKAALDSAHAALQSAKIELSKTKLRAPFAGIFEMRHAEIGDFLAPGAACGLVVDLDPIVIAIDVSAEQAARLSKDSGVEVALSNGERMEGTVRFVSKSANAQTRTFKVEVALPNPDYTIPSGATATVRLNMGDAEAVQISPANLVLHDDGRVGVRYVDRDDIVRFSEITVIDDSGDGVWVTGLSDNIALLETGQDFLKEGTKVSPASRGL